MSLYETYLSKTKEYLINEILKSWEINHKLQHQLRIQTKRVENLKKSNEFYISYLDDSDVITGKQRDRFGGKHARSCQAIDQELEKRLGEVK